MDLSSVVAKIRESLPLIFIANSQNRIIGKGSGFIYQQGNLVVTNAHVVDGSDGGTVSLQFPDNPGNFITAKVVITDHEHDIALLKFTPDKPRAVLNAAPDEPSEGMPVMFSGYPFELTNLTTHQGIISSIVDDPTGMKTYLIDGSVNSGNSGGPLMNIKGEVIGVINAKRLNQAPLLATVQNMPIGALSLHGVDLVQLYGALMENLQVGMGYAVPSSYIPTYADTTKKPAKQSKEKEG